MDVHLNTMVPILCIDLHERGKPSGIIVDIQRLMAEKRSVAYGITLEEVIQTAVGKRTATYAVQIAFSN